MLSALAHGSGADTAQAVQIAVAAIAASAALDPDRSMLNFDLVYSSLTEAARRALQAMGPAKYEFQSEFARRYLSQGREEGRHEGRHEGEVRLLLKLLGQKFGPLSATITERIQSASAEELDRWAARVLTASSVDDVLA